MTRGLLGYNGLGQNLDQYPKVLLVGKRSWVGTGAKALGRAPERIWSHVSREEKGARKSCWWCFELSLPDKGRTVRIMYNIHPESAGSRGLEEWNGKRSFNVFPNAVKKKSNNKTYWDHINKEYCTVIVFRKESDAIHFMQLPLIYGPGKLEGKISSHNND